MERAPGRGRPLEGQRRPRTSALGFPPAARCASRGWSVARRARGGLHLRRLAGFVGAFHPAMALGPCRPGARVRPRLTTSSRDGLQASGAPPPGACHGGWRLEPGLPAELLAPPTRGVASSTGRVPGLDAQPLGLATTLKRVGAVGRKLFQVSERRPRSTAFELEPGRPRSQRRCVAAGNISTAQQHAGLVARAETKLSRTLRETTSAFACAHDRIVYE